MTRHIFGLFIIGLAAYGLTPDDLRRILTALVAIVARVQEAVAALDEWRNGVEALVEYP